MHEAHGTPDFARHGNAGGRTENQAEGAYGAGKRGLREMPGLGAQVRMPT